MPLRVWLPLLGDTNNQGLSEYIFNVSNTSYITVDNAGKLGKCYNFNSSATNNGIYSPDNGFMNKYINNHSFSLCAWVQTSASDTCVMSLSYGLRMFAGDSSHTYVNLYNSSRTVNCKSPIAVNDGKWHHLCATYNVDTNKINIYVDGENTRTKDYPTGSTYASSWANGLFIGRDPDNNAVNDHYLFKGKMNDIRIYDHALSPKEVKLLSQGLVAHYTLGDRGQENLALNSHRNIALNSSYNIANFDLSEELTAGNKYTVTIKGVLGTDKWFGVWMGGGYTHCGYCTQVSENIFRLTFTSPTTVSGNGRRDAINIYAGPSSNTNQSSLEWLKIEKGDKATSWLPNPADAEYTIMGYNESIVYDSSGFNYHGKKEGTISVDSNTPRYSVSTKFAASSGSFSHPNITLSQFTFSFWAKHSVAGKMLMGSCSSISSNNAWYWYGDNSFKYPSGEFYYAHNAGSAASLLGTWIHFVAVYDGANITVYRNGVNEGSKSATGSMLLEYLSVGFGLSTSYSEDGYVSDFRVYATALSADDIKQLYNTPESIANNGSVLTQGEFVEV